MNVVITKVLQLLPAKIFIQWDLINPTESGSYTFAVDRSGSINGPWETIATLGDSFNYIDDFTVQPHYAADSTLDLFSIQREIFYRVTANPPSGSANAVTGPAHGIYKDLKNPYAGVRRRLQYDENIIWARINGTRLALLKRRRWGVRCDVCFDPVTKACVREDCPTCYGTTFKDGYWAPVLVNGRIHPPHNPEAHFDGSGDTSETAQHLVTIPDVPLLQDEDLIIELETNRRHSVLKKTQTEVQRKAIHQQLTTIILAQDSIEYTIPVDFSVVPPLF